MGSNVLVERGGLPAPVGAVSVLGLLALSAVALSAGLWKVVAISWVAFLAMAVAVPPGAHVAAEETTRTRNAYRLVWGYGLAAGAMVTSAAVFLVPEAITFDPKVGGFGIAAGLVVGYAAHTVGHRLAHIDTSFDDTVARLTAHTLSEGLIIGLVYAALPDLGLLLGFAIFSHKGPAGYAAARRLRRAGKPVSVLLLPAAGVGLTALPVALLEPPSDPVVNAAVLGFAAGVFLHVAMDFLPECEVGSEVGEVADLSGDDHALLDRLRLHAVASTVFGAFAVFVAWLALTV